MGKLAIALIAVVAAVVIAAAASAYVASPPSPEMISGMDEFPPMVIDEIPSDIMEYPAAVAFVEKHLDSYAETESGEAGGTKTTIVSGHDGSQLTIERDADGTVTNMEYICFYPDGLSMEIIEGPDVAGQIPTLC